MKEQNKPSCANFISFNNNGIKGITGGLNFIVKFL